MHTFLKESLSLKNQLEKHKANRIGWKMEIAQCIGLMSLLGQKQKQGKSFFEKKGVDVTK